MNEAITMCVTLRLIFPTSIDWALHSSRMKALYAGNESGVIKIADEDWIRHARVIRDTSTVFAADITSKTVYQREVPRFDIAADGKLATWSEDDRIVLFDLETDTVLSRVEPTSQNESFIESRLDPTGAKALIMVEIDKDTEDFLLYEWRLLDIDKNLWMISDSKPSSSPDAFLSWRPGGDGFILHHGAMATLYEQAGGSLKSVSLDLAPPLAVDIESASYDPDGTLLALCCELDEDDGGIYIYSGVEKKTTRLSCPSTMKVNPDNASWSPAGNLILVRDHSSSEPVLMVVSPDGKRVQSLSPLTVEGVDEPVPKWMPDGRHIYWCSGNALNIVRIVDRLFEK